eukprot:Rmarinus@m.8045
MGKKRKHSDIGGEDAANGDAVVADVIDKKDKKSKKKAKKEKEPAPTPVVANVADDEKSKKEKSKKEKKRKTEDSVMPDVKENGATTPGSEKKKKKKKKKTNAMMEERSYEGTCAAVGNEAISSQTQPKGTSTSDAPVVDRADPGSRKAPPQPVSPSVEAPLSVCVSSPDAGGGAGRTVLSPTMLTRSGHLMGSARALLPDPYPTDGSFGGWCRSP